MDYGKDAMMVSDTVWGVPKRARHPLEESFIKELIILTTINTKSASPDAKPRPIIRRLGIQSTFGQTLQHFQKPHRPF